MDNLSAYCLFLRKFLLLFFLLFLLTKIFVWSFRNDYSNSKAVPFPSNSLSTFYLLATSNQVGIFFILLSRSKFCVLLYLLKDSQSCLPSRKYIAASKYDYTEIVNKIRNTHTWKTFVDGFSCFWSSKFFDRANISFQESFFRFCCRYFVYWKI